MIWNVFFVVFVVLVLAAIGLTVWFLKLGKRIFLLIPLLLLAGSVAYFAVYYTVDNNFPPAQVMIASNFPSTVNSALVEESLQKADGNYTRTDEYDTGTVQYTLRLTSEEQQNATAFFDAKPTIRGGEYTRSDIKTSLAMKYTDICAQRTGALQLRTGRFQQEFYIRAAGYTCDVVITSNGKDNKVLLSAMKKELAALQKQKFSTARRYFLFQYSENPAVMQDAVPKAASMRKEFAIYKRSESTPLR